MILKYVRTYSVTERAGPKKIFTLLQEHGGKVEFFLPYVGTCTAEFREKLSYYGAPADEIDSLEAARREYNNCVLITNPHGCWVPCLTAEGFEKGLEGLVRVRKQSAGTSWL